MTTRDLCLEMYSKGMARGIDTFYEYISQSLEGTNSETCTKDDIRTELLIVKSMSYDTIPNDEVREEKFAKSYINGYIEAMKETCHKVVSSFEALIAVRSIVFISDVKKALRQIKEDVVSSERKGDSEYDIGWNQYMEQINTLFPQIEVFFGTENVVFSEKIQELIDEIKRDLKNYLDMYNKASLAKEPEETTKKPEEPIYQKSEGMGWTSLHLTPDDEWKRIMDAPMWEGLK